MLAQVDSQDTACQNNSLARFKTHEARCFDEGAKQFLLSAAECVVCRRLSDLLPAFPPWYTYSIVGFFYRVLLLAFFVTFSRPVNAGPLDAKLSASSRFAKMVYESDAIVELELRVVGKVSRLDQDAGDDAMPRSLIRRSLRDAKVTRVLKGPIAKIDPREVAVFNRDSECWWKARKRGVIKALVFYRKGKQMTDVELNDGGYTNLNPDYRLMTQAVLKASRWEKKVHRSQAQQEFVKSTNPYTYYLATVFLRRTDESGVASMGFVTRQGVTRMHLEPSGRCYTASEN